MLLSPIQAGIRSFLLGLVLPSLLLAGVAQAAPVSPTGQKGTAKPEEALSLDDLMAGAENLLPWKDSKDAPSSKPAPPQEAPAGKEATPPAPIVAKTLDAAPTKGVQPTAPYKVYPSPYVPDDMTISPPLTGAGADGYARDRTPIVQAPDLPPEMRKTEAPPPAGPVAVPVNAMSRQYFPLLPLNAPPDTPPQMLPLASNLDLAAEHPGVSRAIIFIHDLSRDASEGLSMMTTLAGTDNGTTMILAPQFPLEADIARFAPHLPDQGRGIARWPVSRNSGWQTGEDSLARPSQKGISSFTAMDLLLLYLADRKTFPGLGQVVIAGHGMGADFVQRYAAMGQAPDILKGQNLPVRFLVANASSYLYLTGVRPAAGGSNFVIPDASQCRDVNNYPYGLNNLAAYARRSGGNAIRLSYPERRVMFLLSEKIASDPYLDTDCAATAQGKDRLARGRNYERYLMMSFGDTAQETQSFTLVPNAGYDPVSLFGSYCGLSLLFGDGNCKPATKAREETRSRY